MLGMTMRPVSIAVPILLGFGMSACQNTYLGRLTALRGVDVDDRTRLPLRMVAVASPGAPLPAQRDTSWVARVRPRIGGHDITTSTALDSVLDANGTRAFLVLHRGTLIDVRYFHGAGPDSLFKTFSISKSILSALVGIAEADGALRRTDSVGAHLALPENPTLAGVQLQHLLDNTSSFRYRRGGLPWREQPRMYYTTDARAYVRGAQVAGEPGRRFVAEDLSPILMGYILERALRAHGDTSTLAGYAGRRLWGPMGATAAATWNLDHGGDGLEKGESGFAARAEDLARFGLLYLRGGRTGAEQVVPAEWVATTVMGPPAGAPTRFVEGFYHNFWWGATRPGRTTGDFYANGHFGQRIYVSPDHDLVIVRLGHSAGAVDWTDALANIADRWSAPAPPR
jgi:CubicO group peptidase (beta-lactamase class C family)